MLSIETGMGEIKMRNVTYYFIVSKVGLTVSKVAIRLVLYYHLLVVFWGGVKLFCCFFY